MPYTHKDFVPPGYEIESVAGTDVATTRVAFPGELVDFQFMPEFPKEVSSGPATYTPVGAYGTFFNMGCRVTLKPYFDNLATSLLALLLDLFAELGPNTGLAERLENLTPVLLELLTDRQDCRLHRREPNRKCARVMLD